jgi:hypothetical protein
LPLISPLTSHYKTWSSLILLLDLTYTAFLIPILVGFEVPDVGWGWGCIINLVAGTLCPYFMTQTLPLLTPGPACSPHLHATHCRATCMQDGAEPHAYMHTSPRPSLEGAAHHISECITYAEPVLFLGMPMHS